MDPLYSLIHCFPLIVCFCSPVCPPPDTLSAAQSANANADFANFDAFGSTSGSTGGFPSAPHAPVHHSSTGRANVTHPNHGQIQTLALCAYRGCTCWEEGQCNGKCPDRLTHTFLSSLDLHIRIVQRKAFQN